MRVLVAMSGGVDSSVAAALLVQSGADVVGATMKLWGGPSDTGCCSVADVDDARRVAQQLGIAHHVFNFSEEFERWVVAPYVADHAAGRTPNPCVECNRHLKFDRLLARAAQLGFDAVATGHHARVQARPSGGWVLRRGVDPAKDQSYVLHMLSQEQLGRIRLPVGELMKTEVRRIAAELGLRTAGKPDSQDVCFISRSGGREEFLGARIGMHPAKIVDGEGTIVGEVPAVQLVTLGQRRRLGVLKPAGAAGAAASVAAASSEFAGDAPAPVAAASSEFAEGAPAPLAAASSRLAAKDDPAAVATVSAATDSGTAGDGPRYVINVDIPGATVTVGPLAALLGTSVRVRDPVWVDGPPACGEVLEVQVSAHGRPVPATWSPSGVVTVAEPIRRVAPGQSVVLYRGDAVVGGGLADWG